MNNNKTYTVKEIAELLDFSTNTVYKYLDEGKIQSTRLGKEGRFRIPEAEVARLLQAYRGRPSFDSAEPKNSLPDLPKDEKEAERTRESFIQSFIEKDLINFPNLCDWLAGFMGIFVGVAYFLFPIASLRGDYNLYFNFAKYLQLSLIAVGTSFLLSEIFIPERKLAHKVFHFFLAGLLALFAYLSWKIANPMTAIELGAISLFLFLNIFIRAEIKTRYVAIINIINLVYSLILLLSPESLDIGIFTKGLINQLTFSVLWGLYCFTTLIFSIVLLKKEKDSFWVKFVLSILFSAAWLSLRSAITLNWNLSEMMSSLVLVGFVLVFPFWVSIKGGNSEKDKRSSIVGLCSLLFFLVLGLTVVSIAYRSFKEYLFTEIGRRADSGVVLADSYMEVAKSRTIIFSQNSDLGVAMQRSDLETVNRIIKEFYLTSSDCLRRIYVIDLNGKILAAYPYDERMIDLDVNERQYFQQIKNGGNFFLSNTLKPLANTAPIILVLSAPLSDDNGQLSGIIATSVSLEDLENELEKVKLSPYGAFSIVDEEGNYMVNPDKSKLLTKASKGSIAELAYQGKRGEVRAYNGAGELSFQAYRPISSLGWGLVADERYYDIFNAYRTVSSVVFLIVVVLDIGILVMINFLKE